MSEDVLLPYFDALSPILLTAYHDPNWPVRDGPYVCLCRHACADIPLHVFTPFSCRKSHLDSLYLSTYSAPHSDIIHFQIICYCAVKLSFIFIYSSPLLAVCTALGRLVALFPEQCSWVCTVLLVRHRDYSYLTTTISIIGIAVISSCCNTIPCHTIPGCTWMAYTTRCSRAWVTRNGLWERTLLLPWA